MKIVILGFLLILFQGCASGVQKLRHIEPGMSPGEVEEIMGERDGFKTSDKDGESYTLYQYTNQLCNGHVSLMEKCDFFVIFKNNKVIEVGTKDVRSNAPNMAYMYIFR